MNQPKHRVARDPDHGFRRLDPLPSHDELSSYYESAYYHEIRRGGRAPELRRFLEGGETAQRERDWLAATLWADVADSLERLAPGRRVLEVGCGTGDLLDFLAKHDFRCEGLEPAAEAAALAEQQHGLPVHAADLASFVAGRSADAAPFDAVLLMNVLEHVVDPKAILDGVARLLAPGGLACVRVPNDFTAIQEAARAHLSLEPWWIAPPDHVHYFDYASLGSLMAALGLPVIEQQADFPMELFLLAGRNYVSDPGTGGACHRERVAIEQHWPAASRRRFYRALADAGMGRNCLVYGRKQSARVDMAALDEREAGYRYVALRRDDLEPLRGFRNAQLRVLRQKAPLTPEDQERYWREHVVPEHASPAPRSLLVSILENDRLVGYGGLTNLDWEEGRAEISFLVDPRRADDGECYARDLSAFLAFVQRWAFGPLGLHRLFAETYAFREAHIALLEAAGLRLEGRLRDQIRDPASGAFADSVIHAVLGQGDE